MVMKKNVNLKLLNIRKSIKLQNLKTCTISIKVIKYTNQKKVNYIKLIKYINLIKRQSLKNKNKVLNNSTVFKKYKVSIIKNNNVIIKVI